MMATEIAHVLFVDIVGWSKGSMEAQAGSLKSLNDAIRLTPSFSQAQSAGSLDILPTGDGFAVLFFGDLTAPVKCALELSKDLDIPVRIGIHSGPIQRQADLSGKPNFVGEGINYAKRVLDMAEPGEVLLSEAYAKWIGQLDEWAPRLKEHGTGTAKHGVVIKLFSLANEKLQKPAATGKRFVILYRRKAHPDEELMRMIERRLPEMGMEVFVDRHLRIGVEWARSIEARIREADAAIVLLSEASMTSEMIEAELEIAVQSLQTGGKPKLLPIRIGGPGPIEGPLANHLAHLNYGVWSSSEDDDRLLDEIVRASQEEIKPVVEPSVLEADTGGLSPDSPLYVERVTDAPFHQALRSQESILLVKGPRQMGKTSLLARGIRTAEAMQARMGFTDFQKFSGPLLTNEDVFYKFLATNLAKQIGFAYDFQSEWDSFFGAGICMDTFLRAALEASEEPIVWFMDEADKLFTAPFASDFYGLVRSWHNSRATEPRGPWSRLTVAIAYATEAHLFIQDLNQSPFNVGRKFELGEFSLDQVAGLSTKLGGVLKNDAEVRDLAALIGGQPFLVRRALNYLSGGHSLAQLIESANREDGPFGDHLKRLLVSVSRLDNVLAAARSILAGKRPADAEALSRLVSAGVVVEDDAGPRMRNQLYRAYLARHLES